MIGFYYPDSHMWGSLFIHFFQELDIDFELIDNLSFDKLRDIELIIVPGGFASQKIKRLRDRGLNIIRDFVKSGGSYIGICGGAGLALSHGKFNLGICPLGRKDMTSRVPNFSGHIWVNLNLDSSLGINGSVQTKGQLPVWWPSQFNWDFESKVRVLASYKAPGDDLWIADIPYNILKCMDISLVQDIYGINLDFDLIRSDPCILVGDYFKGRFVLSYPHLETPSSEFANRLFVCILSELLQKQVQYNEVGEFDIKDPEINWPDEDLVFVKDSLVKLICKAQENFLMCWRKKWLLGWRRGVIGLCVNSLLCMCSLLIKSHASKNAKEFWRSSKKDFLILFNEFVSSFEKYIILQREFYLENPQRPPDRFGTSKIHKQILKLTGPFPGDGGLFKDLSQILEKITASLF